MGWDHPNLRYRIVQVFHHWLVFLPHKLDNRLREDISRNLDLMENTPSHQFPTVIPVHWWLNTMTAWLKSPGFSLSTNSFASPLFQSISSESTYHIKFFPSFLVKSVEIKKTLEKTRQTFPSTAPIGIPSAILKSTPNPKKHRSPFLKLRRFVPRNSTSSIIPHARDLFPSLDILRNTLPFNILRCLE